jgi:hypothetical protein
MTARVFFGAMFFGARKTGELAWKSSASFKLLKEDETKVGLARAAEDMGPAQKDYKQDKADRRKKGKESVRHSI